MQQITKKFFNWASILEDKTRDQAARTSEMPFIYPHLALMPDAHLGMGATVGSVIPTLGAIMPAAVGVDIGCGMIAKRTQYPIGDLPARDQYAVLRTAIENVIPLSKGGYNEREHAGYTTDRLDALARKANDLGFDPLQIVIKMTRCNGRPVAKLSDSPGKSMTSDEVYLAYLRQTFQITSPAPVERIPPAGKPAGGKAAL